MKTDLSMDDDQLARFIDLLSDRCKEDTWQSLSDMVINAGLNTLETMGEEMDNHAEEGSEDRQKLAYVCDRCKHTSCHLTMESSEIYLGTKFLQEVYADCPLQKWINKVRFQLVTKPGEFTRGGEK